MGLPLNPTVSRQKVIAMIGEQFLNVIKMVCKRFANDDINWAVTGSLGMALQGVNVEVHDIDLQTDRNGAYEIEKHLSEFVVRPAGYSEAEQKKQKY